MRYLLIFAFLLPSVWGIAQSTTKEMVNALRESATQGVMYGHHDDTMYGYRWKDENGERSDTKDVVDMYPAMMSFELCRLEKGLERNIDGVSFDKMHAAVRQQHARGGYVMFSWHADNILTGKNAWDVSNRRVVQSVLPGGSKADEFLVWLDRLAAFFMSLTDEQGKPIPVIFRPWHECNGSWFWWGKDFCTPREYKALCALTVKHLKRKGVNHLIYAYSPGSNITSQQAYLERYPGNKTIAIMGVEGYAIKATGALADRQKFIGRVRKCFDVVAPLAQKRKKILAFTETGMKQNTDPQWWTQTLLPSMEGYPVCFLVTWRNATNDDDECYGIYKGHPSEEDFKRFAQNPHIIFRK